MIISSSILKSAVSRHNRTKKVIEKYSKSQAAAAGFSAAFDSFILVIAIVFFLLELIALFFAIKIVLSCTKGGPERIVHYVLAVTFTLPYLLLNSLFNDCAKNSLRGST